MGFDITKKEFEALAIEKLADAELLLKEKRWSSAYYLSGYAVECAFKVCITKAFKAETLPDKNFVNSTYNHDLKKLAEQAKLQGLINAASPALKLNWTLANVWVPEARYKSYTEATATEIFQAISDKADGVFEWIKAHW